MSDPIDAALRGLRGQRPPVPFAPADAVRRRGRQRATRQSVAAGVAVLAVVGGSAGIISGYVRGPGPDNPPAATTAAPSSGPTSAGPTSSQSPTPGPTTPSATGPTGGASPYLSRADLGPGNWAVPTGAEPFENGRSVWSPPYCPTDTEAAHPTTRRITDFGAVIFNAQERTVLHAVEVYARGTTDERLAEIRAMLARCSRTTRWPSGETPTRYTVTNLPGIGDEAFLVREETFGFVGDTETISPTPTSTGTRVVLRVGDRMATVAMNFVDDAYARTLAEKAAARLR